MLVPTRDAKGLVEMPGQVVPAPDDTDGSILLEAPRAAAFTGRFYRRDVNHEAVGLTSTGQRTDAVMTHGLPNSTEPERAAYLTAHSGLDALDGQPHGDPVAAIRHAYDRAAEDILDDWLHSDRPRFRAPQPPGTTWLAVRVVRESRRAVIAYGWVGNSRVYWLPRHGTPELLTADHYTAFEDHATLRGMMTRWLEPHLKSDLDTGTTQVTGPGLVVLASPQVCRGFESTAELAERLGPDAYAHPAVAIDQLVDVEAPDYVDDRTLAVVAI